MEGRVIAPGSSTDADGDDASGGAPDDLRALTQELEAADALTLEERLELLQRAEAVISRSLEGLDGL